MSRDQSLDPRLDRRHFLSLAAIGGATLLAACGGGDSSTAGEGTPTSETSGTPTPEETSGSSTSAAPVEPSVAGTVATGLTAPWGLTFLPSGDALVAERDDARIVRVTADGRKSVFGRVDGVDTGPGEGGLLGLAVSPDGSELYAYLTTDDDNRVVAYELAEDGLGARRTVIDGIERNQIHNGGRLRFGPDGLLYVSTGDAGTDRRAQDTDSLNGKILRLQPSGDPASGNPFDNAVFSYGHRNVQGLAFDSQDRLWASEFGNQETDELNLIEAGGNYGWPDVEGRGGGDEYVQPRATWATDDCSPSGIAIAGSTVLVCGLAGQSLYGVTFDGDTAMDPQRYFDGEYGRLRTIEPAPDGSMWLVTNNTDTRGNPNDGDDRILRLSV